MPTKAKILIGIFVVVILLSGSIFFVLRDDIDNMLYQFGSWQLQRGEAQLYGCSTDTDCVLVQDGWCRTVIAINKDRETKWKKENARQTEIAEQNRQTCKPTLQEYTDINNFQASCQQSRCKAIFIGDTPQPEVTITTDKTEYEQGEILNIIVKNNLDEEIELWQYIWFEKYNEDEKTFEIIAKQLFDIFIKADSIDNSWECSECGPCWELAYVDIKGKGVHESVWDQDIQSCINAAEVIKKADSGKYRIKLQFAKSGPVVYSNEFTIK